MVSVRHGDATTAAATTETPKSRDGCYFYLSSVRGIKAASNQSEVMLKIKVRKHHHAQHNTSKKTGQQLEQHWCVTWPIAWTLCWDTLGYLQGSRWVRSSFEKSHWHFEWVFMQHVSSEEIVLWTHVSFIHSHIHVFTVKLRLKKLPNSFCPKTQLAY